MGGQAPKLATTDQSYIKFSQKGYLIKWAKQIFYGGFLVLVPHFSKKEREKKKRECWVPKTLHEILLSKPI